MKYNKLIESITSCETMKEIQLVTEHVNDEFEQEDFATNGEITSEEWKLRHTVYNVLSDKTFEVFLKENPKSEPKKVVKKRTTKSTKAKTKTKTKRKTTTKKLVTN